MFLKRFVFYPKLAFDEGLQDMRKWLFTKETWFPVINSYRVNPTERPSGEQLKEMQPNYV